MIQSYRLFGYVGAALCLLSLLLACASDSSSAGTKMTLTPIKALKPTDGVLSESQEVVAQAVADLAERLAIDPSDVALVELEAVQWPNTALGCPQRDMVYAQVVTPGFRALLEAQGQRFTYHTDRDRTVVWCQEGAASEAPSKSEDTNVQDGWPSQPRDDEVIVVPPLQRKQKP